MANYRLSEPAQRDFLSLAEHIASDNIPAARKMVDRIEAALVSLAESPGMGHLREDLTEDVALRFWAVGPYLIIYRTDTTPLEVIRIVHGARDTRRELRGGEGT